MESLADVMRPVLAKLGAVVQNTGAPEMASRGDSALEERFWGLVDETVGGREESLDQFEIGKYRVDSIFLIRNGAAVIELDGAEYHKDQEADRKRDKELLKHVTGVIHIRYYDLMTFPRSTIFTIGSYYERFRFKNLRAFDEHDDPRTANLLGITWYGGARRTDADIIRRIRQGRRKTQTREVLG